MNLDEEIMTDRHVHSFARLLVLLTPLACATASSRAAERPCFADGARLSRAVQEVQDLLAHSDSARLAEQGLPTGAIAVRPLADPATCAAVLGAYNGRYPAADSAKRLPAAPILEASGSGRTVYVLIDDRGGPGYIVFSRSLEWLAGIIGLH